ncbi:unnamed protein product [Candida parapsilosis]
MTSIAGHPSLEPSSVSPPPTQPHPPSQQPHKRVRRLPPEKRQKVSTACDSCKKRKFKCSGSNPCELCVRKGYDCSYTVVDKRSLKSERLLMLRQQKRLQEQMDVQGGSSQTPQQYEHDINKGPFYTTTQAQQQRFQQQDFNAQPQAQPLVQHQQQHALQNPPPPPPPPQPPHPFPANVVYQQQPYPNQQITPPDAPPYQSPQAQQPQQYPPQYPQPQVQLYQVPPNYQAGPPPPAPPVPLSSSQYPPYPPPQRLSVPISPRYAMQPYPPQGQDSYAADTRSSYSSRPPSYSQGQFYDPPSSAGSMGPPGNQLPLQPQPKPQPQAEPRRESQSPLPQPYYQNQHPNVQSLPPQRHQNYQYGAPSFAQSQQERSPRPSSQLDPQNHTYAIPHVQHEQQPPQHVKKEIQMSQKSANILTPDSPGSNMAEKQGAGSFPKFLQPLLSFPSKIHKEGDSSKLPEATSSTSVKTEVGSKNTRKERTSAASTLQNEVDSNAVLDEEIANEVGDGGADSSESKDGVSNQAGKSCILLNDKSGTFRYMGETSPLSVLYETRNIFYQYVGKTKLTEDLRGCPVIDKPLKVEAEVVAHLPPPRERDLYIEQFKRNINDTFFVYELKKFYIDVVDPVYLDPVNVEHQQKLVQLYFVLAIGATYLSFSKKDPHATLGAKYFESGLLIQNSLPEDSEIWCVVAHYLQFHYYQSILKKSTAWIHLNLAIKFAQSLGLHHNFVNEQFSQLSDECEYRKRIFRSLYCSDRISSVFIGRPLAVNDYDWDDPTRYKSSKTLISSSLNFNAKCQIELARISHLIGKIVANFYQNRIIDINRTKNLAVQLKLWSKNLDPLLSVENIFKPKELPHNEDGGNTQIVLMMHLLQLFAIMLLCRPFFMYDAVSHVNTAFPKTTTLRDKSSSRQFIQAATKASILAVKLMNHYINTSFKEVKRMECYIIITCCFYSSIFIGISILNGNYQFDTVGGEEEEQGSYTETEMMNLLRNAVFILNHYSTCNKGAERYAEIGSDLIDALANRHKSGSATSGESMNEAGDTTNESLLDGDEVFNYFNFTDDANAQDLQNLIDFQQFFVSSDITTGSVSDSSNMPYDYGNYDLFFGDKY